MYIGEFLRSYNNNDIKKYHYLLPLFHETEINQIIKYLIQNTHEIIQSMHYKQRCKDKNISPLLFRDILKNGKCFEYKLIGTQIFRLALRVPLVNKDVSYIIEPGINSKGYIAVKYITAYQNNKTDKHSTLDVSRYSFS